MRATLRSPAITVTLGLAAAAAAFTLLGSAEAANNGPVFTMAQVRQHATASNCWTVVNGNVYNLTKWIPRHPGGAGVIRAMCGVNGTAAFKAKHGLRGGEAKRLASFRIGTLRVVAAPTPSASTPAASGALTVAAVATHKSVASCWTIVNGNVYDLTTWIGKHPGGPVVIKALCGIDGSAAFAGMHGQAAKPNAMLATFLLGPVQSGATPSPTPTPSGTPTDTATAGTVLSAAEVAKHNSPGDCWTIIDGTVYALTNWIGAHPGGPGVIQALCGIDGSAAFTAKHSSSATAHAKLAGFALGALGSTVGNVSAPPAPPAGGGGGGVVTPPTPTGPGMNGETLTVAIVAQHAAAASCWTIVNGNVYDLTNWIPAHPGGQAVILALCGIDGSAAFTTKHSSSATAQAKLAAFKIGTLGSPAVIGTPPPAPTPGNTIYTAADVWAHASATSCWAVVNTTVYDLTDWIDRHPGGRQIIIAACGRNATNAFVTQEHHGATQYQVLETFAIGAISSADAASLNVAPRDV